MKYLSKCILYFTFVKNYNYDLLKITIMNSKLLPHTYQKIGWFLLLPAFVAGVFFLFKSNFVDGPEMKTFGYFGDELLGVQKKAAIRIDDILVIPNVISVLFLIGGLFVMFSKEKKEDEYINQIRLKSFQYSVFLNYILLFFCILFIHGIPFFHVMVYNLFTIIVIYILRFQYLIYKNSINE